MITRKEKIEAMQRTLNVLKEQYYDGGSDFKSLCENEQAYKTISKIMEKLKKDEIL